MGRTFSPTLLALGFVAGALAVPTFHQLTVLVLHSMGLVPNFPWSLRPVPPLAVPTIANQMFWGGLWGVLFAALAPYIPGRDFWLKGLIFGILGPWLLGNGILVPLAKGGPLLFGFVPARMIGIFINGFWGVGTGLIYAFLVARFAGRFARV